MPDRIFDTMQQQASKLNSWAQKTWGSFDAHFKRVIKDDHTISDVEFSDIVSLLVKVSPKDHHDLAKELRIDRDAFVEWNDNKVCPPEHLRRPVLTLLYASVHEDLGLLNGLEFAVSIMVLSGFANGYDVYTMPRS